MQKIDRHQAILELIASRPIGRQSDLVEMLTGRGFGVTQASVSRDLEELGIRKFRGRYVQRVTAAAANEFGLSRIDTAGENLVVVRCKSGLASAAAVRIDGAGVPEIIGTIAGDDTIFVAVGGQKEQARAVRKLRKILNASQQNGNQN
jgi:transcriptional regulator of arginine metabolism